MNKHRFSAVIIAMILLVGTTGASSDAYAAGRVYTLTGSKKIAADMSADDSGTTFEEAEAIFYDYIATNPKGVQNVTWQVESGFAHITVDMARPAGDGFVEYASFCSYEVPKTLTPGGKAQMSYSQDGGAYNAPEEWQPEDVVIGALEIIVNGGDSPDELEYLTQLTPYTFNSLANKDVSGVFELDVPDDVKFIQICVYHSTSFITGIGMGYTYKLDETAQVAPESAAAETGTGGSPSDSAPIPGENGDEEASWYATHMDKPKQYPLPVLELVIFGAIAVLVAAVIIIIVVRRRRNGVRNGQQSSMTMPPAPPMSTFCTSCGAPLPPDTSFCTGCGKPRQR